MQTLSKTNLVSFLEDEEGLIYTKIQTSSHFQLEPNYPEEEFSLEDVFSKGKASLFIFPSYKEKKRLKEAQIAQNKPNQPSSRKFSNSLSSQNKFSASSPTASPTPAGKTPRTSRDSLSSPNSPPTTQPNPQPNPNPTLITPPLQPPTSSLPPNSNSPHFVSSTETNKETPTQETQTKNLSLSFKEKQRRDSKEIEPSPSLPSNTFKKNQKSFKSSTGEEENAREKQEEREEEEEEEEGGEEESKQKSLEKKEKPSLEKIGERMKNVSGEEEGKQVSSARRLTYSSHSSHSSHHSHSSHYSHSSHSPPTGTRKVSRTQSSGDHFMNEGKEGEEEESNSTTDSPRKKSKFKLSNKASSTWSKLFSKKKKKEIDNQNDFN